MHGKKGMRFVAVIKSFDVFLIDRPPIDDLTVSACVFSQCHDKPDTWGKYEKNVYSRRRRFFPVCRFP